MINRLEMIEKKYDEINQSLTHPELISDFKKMTELMKESKSIEKTVLVYRRYKKVLEEIIDLKEMLEDPEMQEIAELELDEKETEKEKIVGELEVLLIPVDPNDEKNVIVEIRGAAGGDEADIFAGDLFRMYIRYAESKSWKVEISTAIETGIGGYSQIEFMVKGDSVYSFLKYESGGHRVQRIPQTESQGRIHTSTATVLVMPEADTFDFELDMAEVRIDTFCSSGPGGQSVNTTKSAIRVTHIPTGTIAQCQDAKSQHENKANALKILQARMFDKLSQDRNEKIDQERMLKMGHGDRSEKIRTYNYPQNRVTDHRIGFTIQQLDRVMEGKLDPIIEALITEDQRMKMQGEKE